MRDMMVFDWLFGHRRRVSYGKECQSESQYYADYSQEDDDGCDCRGYGYNDHAQQDFYESETLSDDDDLDSDMFDDSDILDDDFFE